MDKLTKVSMDYLNAIENRLKIISKDNEPIFIPDKIKKSDIKILNNEISDIFYEDLDNLLNQVSVDGKKDKIQGVGYGLVKDFEKFIKVGLLYSNRVILWDYLWGRLISNIDFLQDDIDEIGIVANNLIKIKEVVRKGGIVILPHPTDWNNDASNFTKLTLSELSQKEILYTNTNFGLVTAMSVASELNIHPYTLYNENNPTINSNNSKNFKNLYRKNKKLCGENKKEFIYNITELLRQEPFKIIENASIDNYYDMLSDIPEFYDEFRKTFLSSRTYISKLERKKEFEHNLKKLNNSFKERYKNEKKSKLSNFSETITYFSGFATTLYGLLSPDPQKIPIILGLLTFSASLTKYLTEKTRTEKANTLILGFEKIIKLEKTSNKA